ncbi:MAG: hypothetical protein ACE5I1_25845 [bacterium]
MKAPQKRSKRDYKIYYHKRLEFLDEVGYYYVPIDMNRQFKVVVPEDLPENPTEILGNEILYKQSKI